MKAINTVFSKKLLGTALLLGSVIFTASSQVYYGSFIQNFSPYLFLLISFSITLLFFHLMDRLSSKKSISITSSPTVWKDVLFMNIVSATIFICFYIALKYIEPAVVSSLEWGIGPVVALMLVRFQKPENKLGMLNLLASCGVLIGSIFLAWASLSGASGILGTSRSYLFIGLLFAVLTGIGNVLITFYSKKLSEQGWDTAKILAHRFYLVVLLSGLVVLYEKSYLLISVTDMIGIILITITGTILPLYFMQSSLKYTSPFSFLIISSLVPCFTYLFQLFDPRINLSYFTLIGVIIITVFGFLVIFKKETE
jgi:drug/metabolite transporter (DMT)-like permease